jgi:methyl-accepting chemotaxis protein
VEIAAIDPKEKELLDTRAFAHQAQLALNISGLVKRLGPVFIVLLAIMWLAFRQYPQLLALPILTVLPTAGAWLYPVLHRHDRAKTGIVVFLLSLSFNIFVLFPLIHEIMLPLTILYVFVIILTYMLLKGKEGHWIAGACTVGLGANIVLTTLWNPSWRVSLGETPALVINVLLSTSIMASIALIVYRLMTEQDMLFRQSQYANLKIEKHAAAEKEQHERLQAVAEEYVRYMTQVGQGNLGTRLTLSDNGHEDNDPLILLGHNLNKMVVNLQRMILQIRDASTNLSSATSEILAATTQQASGANEQSAAITQTTTTVDQVKVIAEQLVERGQEVADISQRTVKVSLAGQNTVHETIEGMNRIRERVESIAKNIIALSEQTLQIKEIIATVDDIAAQSNMLALNASVEAAHAGEQGKGFAAVAVEVRNLARQSQQATTQVRAILSQVQKGISDTATTTEGSTKVVEEGMQLAVQTQETIGQLAAVIDESAQMAMQMVAGGRQQASGVEQIAVAMQNINQATAQNLSSTRQTEDAAQNLNTLARSLTETVEQYQL